jgi:hypothetical protein
MDEIEINQTILNAYFYITKTEICRIIILPIFYMDVKLSLSFCWQRWRQTQLFEADCLAKGLWLLSYSSLLFSY